MSEVLEKIRSRGHWRVIIHPAGFDQARVKELSALGPILEKTKVRLLGWSFPFLDQWMTVNDGPDWIGREVNWDSLVELWRFYQSGQFVHYSIMLTDWRQHSDTFSGWPTQWKSDQTGSLNFLLDIKEVMIRLTEIFKFASRLSLSEAGDEQMHLEIDIMGIADHLLRVNPSNIVDFFRPIDDPTSPISFKFDLSRETLISGSEELALKTTGKLFQRFGWDPGISILRDIQYELLGPTLAKA